MLMGNSENTLSDYDSTWEDEDVCEDTKEFSKQWPWREKRNLHAAEDMRNYRRECRSQLDDVKGQDVDNDEDLPNLWFYQNKIPFDADGVCIEDFHMCWFGDYKKLEHVHSYIQWLFPTQENGMNASSVQNLSHVLNPKAIKLFHRDEVMKKRLLTSYKLMLDFYGIELVSEETGEVRRSVNWKERFENLNRNTHNNLRITRILKCLGLLGFHHYQAPLVHFFLVETLVNGTLPQVKQSVLDYFMFAVVDKSKRKELIKFALCYFKPKEKFVWCPTRIRIHFLKEVERAEKQTEHY
ncbi:opioid growth factor receptor-like protein 1 [Ictalurus punctatus]|uniref:Opioid growth factor receptor-like protein 1 n=1 Tax=Ictalurus punctatus TaxID=7998 RepID=A0A2D0PIH3_ICTPU|nr:opioid growth factor receptor-like protein 1 [Ictalurus punctatus]